ncbi:lamin tail domain-containing protein [Bacillus sp. V3B]|nr:lamin tail domain-containing protein [Bacillus sp. V3B]
MATMVQAEETDEGRTSPIPVEPTIKEETLDEIPEDLVAPMIEHTPLSRSQAYTDIVMEANMTDDLSVPYATLYYKNEGDETFTSLAMTVMPENPAHFTVTIPGIEVESDLTYYIEASDGKNTSRTDEHEITVSQPNLDFNKMPHLLVTEVVPDTSNVGGADGYEFIEIYNNTDQPISFEDYKIQYRYGSDPETDVIWESVPDDFVIPSKGTMVFWIINDQNGEKTVADFNNHYKVNLVENKDIIKIYSAGMANGSTRGIVIATNTDMESSVAYYNEESGVDDTSADKGIIYKYPIDGTNQMDKISAGKEAATPGTVLQVQVPAKTVQIPEDTTAPTIEDVTGKTEINQKEDLILTADAKDDQMVKTIALFYKNNEQSQFKKVLLQQDYNDLLYHFTVYSPDLIAKESIEYYYEASDGKNKTKTETHKVTIKSDENSDPLRLNVKNAEFLSGENIVKATSTVVSPEKVQLFIDEKEMTEDTFRSLESESYLAFEVSGVNTFFQNGVTMGDEVLRIFDDWIPQWKTITVPIQPEKLKEGANIFTIRSGDKATPFPTENGENRDDYSLRNVRLVLQDGTVIQDPKYSDPEKVIAMNDANTAVDFTINIPEDKRLSKTYKWNTATVADGKHTIRATDSVNPDVTIKVHVDNTAPVIKTNIEKNKEYKGKFMIEVKAGDALAGVDSTQVKLDDEVITVPYETSSSQLSPGSHTLTIMAVDKIGNKTEVEVPFSVVDELPRKPKLVSPQVGAEEQKRTTHLKVNVTDPTNDDLDVSFYKGFQYNALNSDQVKVFKNAVDTEPPEEMIPAGETAVLVHEEISKIASSDDEYLVTDSNTQFPYHRFDVTIDSSVDESDIVELSWEGHSLEGRKVSMYAWSHEKNEWVMLDSMIAGKEDFILKQNVEAGEFMKDSKINVLVQDEIPVSPDDYDYTFVWMSDTQYYSESFPYVFDRQTQWIVENAQAMKMKYVFHTGDLVNVSDKEEQWKNASQFMKTLDGANIPYGVLAGNHDVDHKTSDYTQFYRFFGEDRYKDRPYYSGSYKNNRGHYDLISANGNDYIMVYMGWGVDDESIAWINQVLAEHPDRKAILSFHEYLLSTGTRHPLGDKIYNEVVVPNKNVIMVLAGHYHEAQTLIDLIDDNGDGTPDRKVYQMLANYQAGPEGGQGYMRLLHFDQDQNRIIVNTYSPYLNDYNYYDPDKYPNKDEFVINLNLKPQQKRMATDNFTVNVYTDSLIGKKNNVKSGKDVQVRWNHLEPHQTYAWYTVVEDDYTGRTVSDIWTFTTGDGKNNSKNKKK